MDRMSSTIDWIEDWNAFAPLRNSALAYGKRKLSLLIAEFRPESERYIDVHLTEH